LLDTPQFHENSDNGKYYPLAGRSFLRFPSAGVGKRPNFTLTAANSAEANRMEKNLIHCYTNYNIPTD
jgi:hypothetical protein